MLLVLLVVLAAVFAGGLACAASACCAYAAISTSPLNRCMYSESLRPGVRGNFTTSGQSLGNFSAQQFIQNSGGKARFNLLVSRQDKSVTLLIDDKLVKQWIDHNPFAGLGEGILFYPQSQGGMRFSNIRVTECPRLKK